MIAPRHTQPPIPPDHGGEPPVTREFNRWLYGLVLPGAVFLWSLFILAGGRFRIPLRIRWREFIDMTGPEAYAVGFLLLLTAVLVHRVRFWYEL